MLWKRFSMVFLTMVLAIAGLLLAAKRPTGPNAVSFDEPVGLWLSLGTLVTLFIPLFILSFFHHTAVTIISALYQILIVFALFVIFIPVGFIVSDGISLSVIGFVGTVASICSIIVTIRTGLKKET